jgi:hypothetical protein
VVVYPIIQRVLTCFNHPKLVVQDAGFRWPIHSSYQFFTQIAPCYQQIEAGKTGVLQHCLFF